MLPPHSQNPPTSGALNPNLGAALAAASQAVPAERVDQVWIFPPRKVGIKESGLAVLVVLPEGDEARARRTIFTLRYEALPEKGKTTRADLLEEQGTVPPDRVARIVEGVVRRLEGGDTEAPDVREVGGEWARWAEVLRDLGGPVLDPPNQE